MVGGRAGAYWEGGKGCRNKIKDEQVRSTAPGHVTSGGCHILSHDSIMAYSLSHD